MINAADKQELREIAISAQEYAGFGMAAADSLFTVASSEAGEALVQINKEADGNNAFYNIAFSLDTDGSHETTFHETSYLDVEELVEKLDEITKTAVKELEALEMEERE